MQKPEKRFREVSKSEFAHEREGLLLLAKAVPDASPYRVWTNFSFTDDQGQWHEVDALVIGQGRIHMVELKSWNGVFSGTDHQIDIGWDGGGRDQKRHPNYTTRKKAQKFVSRLRQEVAKIRALSAELGIAMADEDLYVPWVQECLFLHGDRVHSMLSESGTHNVFGRDGMEAQTNLPGIGSRLTETPGKYPITEKRSRDVLATAIDQIVGVSLPARRPKAGDWELREVIENDEGFVLRAARNPVQKQDGVAYIPEIPANLDPSEKKRREQQVSNTFGLLNSLNSDGIDRPVALSRIDDSDVQVLIYQDHGNFRSMDLLPRSLELTAEQQVDLILQIADAVAYAHNNNVVHRRLAPASVLVSLEPEIRVKISRWSTVSSAEAGASTATRFSTTTAGVYDGFSVFLPPEGFSGAVDRRLGELFSVGALAYFIFSGDMPANDVPRLLDRLRTERGLDLAASNAVVEEGIRLLVLAATDPNPDARGERVAKLLAQVSGRSKSRSRVKDSPVAVFAEAMRAATRKRRSDDGTDPLNPTIGGMIADRFTVERVLGVGSTARGLQVMDSEGGDRFRVLKVGLSPDKTPVLLAEAEAIREVNRVLGKAKVRRHFVDLLGDPLDLPHGRFGLLLTDCGVHTLSDMLQLATPEERGFWDLSGQLLDILVALESTGVVHRDIKPSNLGLTVAGGRQRLMLFDFSLAGVPLGELSVGSPPYHDPFLAGQLGGRTHFDSAAERYSVAVVLLELANRSHPVYGKGGENPATMQDPSLTLAPSDLGAFARPEQREALVAFFRKALAGDHAKRFVTAEEMRAEFLRIRDLKAPAAPAPLPPVPPAPKKLTEPEEPELALAAGITSFAKFAEEIVAYSGKKNTHSRRYVQHILGVADTVVQDPFITASPFAKLLGCSTPRIHQLPKELPHMWAQSEPLLRVLEALREAVLEAVTAAGGIATPMQLEAAVASVLCDDSASSVSTLTEDAAAGTDGGSKPWPRQGVLRLVEFFINRDTEALHPIRRGRQWHMVAFTSSDSLASLPKALEDAAAARITDDRLVPAKEVSTLLTSVAAEHLETSASNLPVAPSILPELATYRSSKVALTPSGELYARSMSLPAMLRNIIRPSTDSIAPSSLKVSLAARFPRALHATVPKRDELAKLIHDIDPSFVYVDGRFTRRTAAPSIGVGTKLPTRTRYEGPRDLGNVDPRLRELFVSLGPTIEDRQLRVISVPLGQTRDVVDALVSQFGAAHVDVANDVVDELRQLMEASGQADKFDALLELDTPKSRSALVRPVRGAANRVLTSAVHADAAAVVLTDVSILARFSALDELRPYADVAGPGNPRALWIVVPHEPGDDAAAAVAGHALPLTSPSQFIRFDRPAPR